MKLAIANWKMNGNPESLMDFCEGVGQKNFANVEMVICPPAPLLAYCDPELDSVRVGAQDCHFTKTGAFTGDVSPALLADLGVEYVILGHSERREYQYESNELIAKKVAASVKNGLEPILCIGESLEQREKGEANVVVRRQLKAALEGQGLTDIIVAYEPIWAIGTGKVPTKAEVIDILLVIEKELENYVAGSKRILYGGSVNSKSCLEFSDIENLSGYLIGSASLKLEEYLSICGSLE